MAVAGAVAACSGSFFFQPHSLPFPVHVPCKTNFWFPKKPVNLIVQSSLTYSSICASSRSNHHYGSSYGDGNDEEPFLMSMMKDIALNLKSIAVFLAEQPSQLNYIEWPTFRSTMRTAILTLVLVALLIVALSSIDSCLCYILALLLRRRV